MNHAGRPSREEVHAVVLAFFIVVSLVLLAWFLPSCEAPEAMSPDNASAVICDDVIKTASAMGASCEAMRHGLNQITARLPDCRAVLGDGGLALGPEVCRRDGGKDARE